MNALKQEGQRVVDLFCHATGWLTADGKPWISRFLRTCISRRWRRLSPQFRAAYLPLAEEMRSLWERCAALGVLPVDVTSAAPEDPGDNALSNLSDVSLAQFIFLQAWVANAPEESLLRTAYGYRTALRFTLTRRPEDDVLMSVAEQHALAALASPEERQTLQSESHRVLLSNVLRDVRRENDALRKFTGTQH